MLKPFSEGINYGKENFWTSPLEETEGATLVARGGPEQEKFEKATKLFIQTFGKKHPNGINAFVKGLDKGLKAGIKPVDIEILFRTWDKYSQMVSDPKQKEMLKKIWPNLKNKIGNLIPPSNDNTIYPRDMPRHPEGLPPNLYSEQKGSFYHSQRGWY